MSERFGVPSIGKLVRLAEERFPSQQCAAFLAPEDFLLLFHDGAAMHWTVEADRIRVGEKLIVYRSETLPLGEACISPIQFVTHAPSLRAGDSIQHITGVIRP